jgi:hypothetical protein
VVDYNLNNYETDTKIVPPIVKLALAGVPLTPIPRIAGAIFHSALDKDPETNGCPWLLLDDGPVLQLEREELKTGVYEIINKRAARASRYATTNIPFTKSQISKM